MNGDPPPTQAGVVTTLQNQLDKPPDDSKKFKVIMRGLYAVCGVFLIGCVMILLKPDAATQITSFGQMVCLSIGGLAGVGAGSIAAVDFKNSGSLAQVVQATVNK
jgi:hypothetical protein